MAIASTAAVQEVSYQLDSLGALVIKVENDAGTERLVARYNGSRVVDWTPAGGHVEQRDLDTPSGYERVA